MDLESSEQRPGQPGQPDQPDPPTPAVRFSSSVQERQITSVVSPRSTQAAADNTAGVTDVQVAELRESLQDAQLQDNRMGATTRFDPISLPVSRVG